MLLVFPLIFVVDTKLIYCYNFVVPLTGSGCYNRNVRFFTYLNKKFFSQELKILNCDGLCENKKFSDENQCFN